MFSGSRRRMIEDDLPRGGVSDARVLEAFARVPREEFVPWPLRPRAYDDTPLPIGHGQTISQPACVGIMVQLLELRGAEDVLEVGTGCGYQTALLRELAPRVCSVERIEPLYELANANLARLGYDDIELRFGDGYGGWGDDRRFDAIVLAAAPREVPQPLLRELKDGGRLVAPIGDGWQELVRVRRDGDEFIRRDHGAVRFVPMLDGVRSGPEG